MQGFKHARCAFLSRDYTLLWAICSKWGDVLVQGHKGWGMVQVRKKKVQTKHYMISVEIKGRTWGTTYTDAGLNKGLVRMKWWKRGGFKYLYKKAAGALPFLQLKSPKNFIRLYQWKQYSNNTTSTISICINSNWTYNDEAIINASPVFALASVVFCVPVFFILSLDDKQ